MMNSNRFFGCVRFDLFIAQLSYLQCLMFIWAYYESEYNTNVSACQSVFLDTPDKIPERVFPARIHRRFCYPAHAPLRTLHQDSAAMKILSLSIDQELSQLRKTILEAAGHDVISLNSDKAALQAVQGVERYDVVL